MGTKGRKNVKKPKQQKDKEEGKVEERHRLSFKYEMNTSHKVLPFSLKVRGLR